MSQMNDLLALRTKKGEAKSEIQSKMAAMAQQSALGHLTSFSGVFSVTELSNKEKNALEELLAENAIGDSNDLNGDLLALISLTSEVKAINNQAALLHGERIKKAHQILTRYRDGAFTGWLMVTYGNRQTPYNFLQYYEFYQTLSNSLRQRVENMPRQAVYTLASRNASIEKKQQVVENYQGETKAALLEIIRKMFPLGEGDHRKENFSAKITQSLNKVASLLKHPGAAYSEKEIEMFRSKLTQLQSLLNENDVGS